YRIDDQCFVPIVCVDFKARVFRSGQDVPPRDRMLPARAVLPNLRLSLFHGPGGCGKFEISLAVNCHTLHAVKGEVNLIRIGTRFEYKVVFQIGLVTMKDCVNPWIYGSVTQACKIGNTAYPIAFATYHVTGNARQLFFPNRSAGARGSREMHSNFVTAL